MRPAGRSGLLAGLVLAVLLPLSMPASAGASAWLAEFVWSPQYCSHHRDYRHSREAQCTQPTGFVLQGLVSVVDGRPVDDCEDGPEMSPALLDQMARFNGNRFLTELAWRRHGRCSGLAPDQWAVYAEHVDRRMSWPDGYRLENPVRDVTTEQIIASIAADNPGLSPEAIGLECRRGALESVTICLDERYAFSAARCPLVRSCGDQVRLRPYRP